MSATLVQDLSNLFNCWIDLEQFVYVNFPECLISTSPMQGFEKMTAIRFFTEILEIRHEDDSFFVRRPEFVEYYAGNSQCEVAQWVMSNEEIEVDGYDI